MKTLHPCPRTQAIEPCTVNTTEFFGESEGIRDWIGFINDFERTKEFLGELSSRSGRLEILSQHHDAIANLPLWMRLNLSVFLFLHSVLCNREFFAEHGVKLVEIDNKI